MNKYYIAPPSLGRDRQQYLAELADYRARNRNIDRAIYDRPDLAWASRAFSCCFVFMYDRSFYNPDAGQYTIDTFLDDGLREFGGYDALILWQGYPRLGVDQRNQFDYYRDMPGGLAALREVVAGAHQKGVRVLIDYNPWDTGTRREGRDDEQVLAELVARIDADGIFLDTMPVAPARLRQTIDGVRQGVVFIPEGQPPTTQLAVCSASWAQQFDDPNPPGLLRLKWIEPRHIQHQIRRWDSSHSQEIESAFFNGSGMLIWENVFGTYNPWPMQDRRTWRRAVPILRHFAANFTSDAWEPFYPTLAPDLFANRWPGDNYTIFTLVNRGKSLKDVSLLRVPYAKGIEYYDLWNGSRIPAKSGGNDVTLAGSIDRLGCILAANKPAVDESLLELLRRQFQLAQEKLGPASPCRNAARSVIEPEPVEPTKGYDSNEAPDGMVFVPGGNVHIQINHPPREAGCYPDPCTAPDDWPKFLLGSQKEIRHDYTMAVKPFFIDETEVTNSQFNQFLKATSYSPKCADNFLKHWPDGNMPAQLAEHPVVYVDIDDARAYAKWADKRLPTESEWHLAAQGTDGRTWPWGNQFDPSCCNAAGDKTTAVKSYPQGKSPFGCYDMAGNVWELTESCRDDGHTRFLILRGGSFFKAKGSDWYFDGGAQPCNHHAKFIRMYPGLDRCATIGFRCVADAAGRWQIQ